MKKIIKNWYLIIIIGFFVAVIGMFAIAGGNSVIAIHDNLDLFVPQYKMMKDTNTFFGFDKCVYFLGMLDRDYLPSELNIVTMMYVIMPPLAAYITCYILKIVIALAGSILLGKDVLKDDYDKYRSILMLSAFAYGILNLFPNFGIPFAAIPFLVYILRKINNSSRIIWYVVLFVYPFISYFSYLGIFFLGFMCIYIIIRWIQKKKFPWQMVIAVPVLSLGYVAFEYRLFNVMLFNDVTSIRETMVNIPYTGRMIMEEIMHAFLKGDMHTEALQARFVMPVCLCAIVVQTVIYIKNGESKKIWSDPLNGTFAFIIFNSVLYGAFHHELVRHLVETILPPLTGFDFSRAEFVNPFLWYLSFFLALKKIYDYAPKAKWVADIMAVIAIMVILFSATRYNDVYSTAVSQARRIINGSTTNNLTYDEYYSTELFDKAKADIGYAGEWSVAYGFYPAVLEYNGIHTLDGYLGYYSQDYKESFRKIIAPALARVPESKDYFDSWGARCQMYSGTNPSIVNAYRDYGFTNENIYIDTNAFKKLGGRYIFSRVELDNAQDCGLVLVNTYTDESSPYTLYLYRTSSWYMDKYHSNIAWEEREASLYDKEAMELAIEEINTLVDEVSDADESYVLTDQQVVHMNDLLDRCYKEISNISGDFCLLEITYYMDTSQPDLMDKKTALEEEYLKEQDRMFCALRDMACTPYRKVLVDRYGTTMTELMEEYEELSEEDIARDIRLAELKDEYWQAVEEDYTVIYNDEEWNNDRLEKEGMDLDDDTYIEVLEEMEKAKAEAVTEIYREIIKLHNKEAQDEGYDNYPEYAYSRVYMRDYTPDDVKKLGKELKKACPLYIRASLDYYDIIDREPGCLIDDDTSTWNKLLPYLNNINPELTYGMQYMLDNNLYNLKLLPEKADLGFTIAMDTYGDAYIFDSPLGQCRDLFTYVHEYGHYNHMFHYIADDLDNGKNMDTAEVDSQGLEMLFSRYYPEIFGEETGEYLSLVETMSILDAVYTSITVAEFEIYAFEHEDVTAEELSQEYVRLYRDMGFDASSESYQWMYINHLYETPMYYISYSTSALAALDLYAMSLEDYDKACTKYMEVSALPDRYPLRYALIRTGLPDIFEKGVASGIIRTTALEAQDMAVDISNR